MIINERMKQRLAGWGKGVVELTRKWLEHFTYVTVIALDRIVHEIYHDCHA